MIAVRFNDVHGCRALRRSPCDGRPGLTSGTAVAQESILEGMRAADTSTVRRLRPDIIYVHCTGFDSRGPQAGGPACDDIIQAASGVASLLPRVDGNEAPRYFPTAMSDKVSGPHEETS
jgi:hypothetical protein